MPRIFISYRRQDTPGYAGRLSDDLRDRFGPDQVFMDIDTLRPGADFVEAIQSAVGSCDALIALIGPRWLDTSDPQGHRRLDDPDDFIRLEIAAALERNTAVIPVLLQGATMPRAQDLPDDLRGLARRQALEISDARWKYDLGRLVETLEEMPSAANTPSEGRAESDNRPQPLAQLAASQQGRKLASLSSQDLRQTDTDEPARPVPGAGTAARGMWSFILLTLLGWLICAGLGEALFNTTRRSPIGPLAYSAAWFIGGAVAGLITALASPGPSLPLLRVLAVAIVAAFGAGISDVIFATLFRKGAAALSDMSLMMRSGLVAGSVGGLLAGLSLSWLEPAISRKEALAIVVAAAGGALAGVVVQWSFASPIAERLGSGITVPQLGLTIPPLVWIWGGFVCLIVLWQVRRPRG